MPTDLSQESARCSANGFASSLLDIDDGMQVEDQINPASGQQQPDHVGTNGQVPKRAWWLV